MNKAIHPEYYSKAKITCACGAEYEAGSTLENISVELCANCHPFYTGTQKIMDTARRVEKFQARVAAKADEATGKAAKRAKRAAQAAEETAAPTAEDLKKQVADAAEA